jgi:lipoprotein-releasing system permease protein
MSTLRVIAFIAARQLWARRGLNGIALAGVALGVLVLVTISGILNGFHQKFLANIINVSPHVVLLDRRLRPSPPLLASHLDDFVVSAVSHAAPSDRPLRIERPHELSRALARLSGVRATAASVSGSSVAEYGARQYAIDLRGVDPKAQDAVTPVTRYVTEGRYAALSETASGAVLGVGVAKRLGAGLSDWVRIGSPSGRSQSFKVVGIFDAGIPPVDNYRVYVGLKDAQAVLGRHDVVSRIEARLDDTERAPALARSFETISGYDAESWQETNANFLAIFRQQSAIISCVVGAVLALGGFGILSVQIMIVLQKTRDIAILRSVGFKRRDILTAFLLQGLVLSLLGALIGDVAGHFLLQALSRLEMHAEGMVRSDTFMIHDDPHFYAYGVVFALVVGMLASLIPALRASRLEPVDVLRGQVG